MHTVVETPEFRAQARKLLDADEISLLVTLLARDSKAGDLIVGTGGFRKLRLARRGEGKSGGYRVIYFYYDQRLPVFLVSVYAKNQKENLSQAQRNQMAMIAAGTKRLVKE